METRELSKNLRELSSLGTWEGWDPVPEWDGFPPERETFTARHFNGAEGRMIAAAIETGDIEAARFEFGGY